MCLSDQFTRCATTIVIALVMNGCSSPTAPSATTPIQPAPNGPPIANPPPADARDPRLSDARFDLTFYRQLVRNGFEQPTKLEPLRRQPEAPKIYLRTVDDGGAPIDTGTLNATAIAAEEVARALTGSVGFDGLERGTDTREGQRAWITIRWSTLSDGACGRAAPGGDVVMLYPRAPNCRCAGGPAVKPLIIKHELGHALGFWHTDSVTDLMHNGGHTTCDLQPSAREQFHSAIAYDRPIGSLDP